MKAMTKSRGDTEQTNFTYSFYLSSSRQIFSCHLSGMKKLKTKAGLTLCDFLKVL